jgi:hypothetical protein
MSREVGMLDCALGVLHRPGSVHLRTACGRDLCVCTIGPLEYVAARADHGRCDKCFPTRAAARDPRGGG